ncbi:MAG: cobalamin B12-binding domain-containing protein, partial [Candidatus Omnitrophica bacterium]|nr:cobalamin B12-binding domain-containing protein [Candidatus Omnitrophota bacterium]
MNIVLINPPFIFSGRNAFTSSPCVGLRSISSFLKKDPGHKVTFLDAFMQGRHRVSRYADGYLVGLSTEEIMSRIPLDTDLIGVSVSCSQLAPVVHAIIARIKDRFSRVTVVLGGVYPSTQPGLALTSRADFIVLGDGEHALAAI